MRFNGVTAMSNPWWLIVGFCIGLGVASAADDYILARAGTSIAKMVHMPRGALKRGELSDHL